MPTDSTGMEGCAQAKLPSKLGKDDMVGLPVQTSTPFLPLTSVSPPRLSSPKSSAVPQILRTSGPSTSIAGSSQSIGSSSETSKDIASQRLLSKEKHYQCPSVHTSSRQGSESSTVSTAITVNCNSSDRTLKQVSTSSGLNQVSIVSRNPGDCSVSPHHSESEYLAHKVGQLTDV